MENNNQSFYQFSDQLRGQTPNLANLSLNDSLWSNNSIWSSSNTHVSKRPDERRNFDIGNNPAATNLTPKLSDFNGFNDTWKIGMGNASIGPIAAINGGSQNVAINGGFNKGVYSNGNSYNYNSSGFNLGNNFDFNLKGYNNNNKNKGNDHHEQQGGKIGKKNSNKKNNNNNSSSNDGGENKDSKNSADKRFKTLPPSEALPRNETIGGYIFVCNNDTMSENLKRELFGLPPRYRDSVRAITPGLPLFLYNYSTHQLHGIFEAASFGGTNIDPTAWEDKKCAGESRFPAQVRVLTRKICEPLEEDSFRPILHHYDGPKFRLELSVPEAISLLDIFDEQNA